MSLLSNFCCMFFPLTEIQSTPEFGTRYTKTSYIVYIDTYTIINV